MPQVLLLDGDRRRQAVDMIEGRLLHLADELPRVSAQALDIPPLAFGVNRVHRQRAFRRGVSPPAGQALEYLYGNSKGNLPVVWACSPSRSSWAVLHVIRRHGGTVETIVVLELDVPAPKRVLCFSELAGASLDE